jgi:iron complex outermembrane receptor protein
LERVLREPVLAPALQQEVTTVSRQESTVGRSSAAVFVITNEMIRRSGARSIPEALRLAPGVNVARIDANKWAISIRGLQSRFSNKLLVQIDGRSVYTPLFAGTYWDVQDVVLEDVERIEVIRGPGASVWGENAVNGIINLITKSAKDTQGALLSGGGGGEERGFSTVRYGGGNGNHWWRVYGKQFERHTGLDPSGNARDDWRQQRAGFRMDWDSKCCDTVTLQGDYYDGQSGAGTLETIVDPNPPFTRPFPDSDDVLGGNLLFRWQHELADDSAWALQVYYDRAIRESRLFDYDRETFDLDFQHNFALGDCHRMIWGAGYRLNSDKFETGDPFALVIDPSKRDYDIASAFVQDEMALRKDVLYFTIGTKLSINDFSDFEVQPTGRLLWLPSKRSAAWAAVSRAVRTPARTSHDLTLLQTPVAPATFAAAVSDPANFRSEELIAYELGYRIQPTQTFSWDLALFYHEYEDLSARFPLPIAPGPLPGTLIVPLPAGNLMDGEIYGVELAATWDINGRWRLTGSYSFVEIHLHAAPGTVATAEDPEGQTAHNQAYVQSSWDLGSHWELDVLARYVDNIPNLNVPHYISMDLRLAWQPRDCLEVAVVAQNLLDQSHREFRDVFLAGTEVERSVYGMATLRW